VSATGRRRACTALFEQLSDLAAFKRFPLMVLSRAATVSPPPQQKILDRAPIAMGSCAFSMAATPVTCGAAIEVPLKTL